MRRGLAATGIPQSDSYFGEPGGAAGFAGGQRIDCAVRGDADGHDGGRGCVYRELRGVSGRGVAGEGSGEAGKFVCGDVDDAGRDAEVVSDGRGVYGGVGQTRGEGVRVDLAKRGRK